MKEGGYGSISLYYLFPPLLESFVSKGIEGVAGVNQDFGWHKILCFGLFCAIGDGELLHPRQAGSSAFQYSTGPIAKLSSNPRYS